MDPSVEDLQPIHVRTESPWLSVPQILFSGRPSPLEGARSKNDLRISREEFWEHYADLSECSYEWANGHLEEKTVTDKNGYIQYLWFFLRLVDFLKSFKIAEIAALEFPFSLENSERRPDLFVIRKDNPVAWKAGETRYVGVPDLVVESLSPATQEGILRDTETKKEEYRKAGVREYFILDYRGIETRFYRLDRSGIYRSIPTVSRGIVSSEALPGFKFRVQDVELEALPDEEELVKDKVYASYVNLSYQAEKHRADEAEKLRNNALKRATLAEQRAETAEQRADTAEQRAETAEQRAVDEKQRAETAEQRAETAEQRTEDEKQRAETAEQRADRERQMKEDALRQANEARQQINNYLTKLREQGIDPDKMF